MIGRVVIVIAYSSLLQMYECEAFGDVQPQQTFRVRPQNLSVVEGMDALLRCEVIHQTGRAQWTKQGFALGYLRHLPGYRRYRMTGDTAAGVHNLQISSVRVEDEGRYQCQVSPNRGQKPIKADAFLSVLVKPSSIRLTAPTLPENEVAIANEPDGNEDAEMAVYEMNVGSQLFLECHVFGAQPPASVVWLRNGVQLASNKSRVLTSSALVTPTTTLSRLSVTLSRFDDRTQYTCRAVHAAIGRGQEALFSRSARISVLYPPGIPEITSGDEATSSEPTTVRAGQKLSLTCRSVGGNPPADLVWLVDGAILPARYTRVLAEDEGDSVSQARVQFTATAAHAKAIFRCQAFSAVQPQPLETTYSINVLYGPKNVSVSGDKLAHGGQIVSLTCSALDSNPASNITWTVNGRVMSDVSQTITGDAREGFGTWSRVSVAVPQGMQHDMEITCNAVNSAVVQTRRYSTLVAVIRPPEPPSIVDFDNETPLASGDVMTVNCVARGGHPLANLSWSIGERQLTSVKEQELSTADGGGIVSQLTHQLKAEDNGKILRCTSSSVAMNRARLAQVPLQVTFAPEKLDIRIRPDNNSLTAGTIVEITCTSSAANPSVKLTWTNQGETITRGLQSQVNMNQGNQGVASRLTLVKNLTWLDNGQVFTCACCGSHLRAALTTNITFHVGHAPIFNRQRLQINVTHHDSGEIELEAMGNPSNISYSLLTQTATHDRLTVVAQSGSRAARIRLENATIGDIGRYKIRADNIWGFSTSQLYVNVLYAPTILNWTDLVVTSVGETVVFECRIDANPLAATMIDWHRSHKQQPNVSNKEASSVGNTDAMDSGGYQNHNSSGLNSELGAATESQIYQTMLRNASRSANDIGNFIEDPIDNKEAAREQAIFREDVSRLTLLQVQESDSGWRTCTVKNGVGVDSKSVLLLIEHTPRIHNGNGEQSSLRRMASSTGSKVTLSCEAQGSQTMSFEWRRKDLNKTLLIASTSENKTQDILQRTGQRDLMLPMTKYTAHTEKLAHLKWRSTLEVKHLDPDDYGVYQCLVSNRHGHTDMLIQLSDLSVPTTPLNLRVANVSRNSAIVYWTPGFNGGLNQTFRIRYKDTSGNREFVRNISGNTTWTVLSQLRQDSKYQVWIAGVNRLGVGNYSNPTLHLRTSGTPPVGYITNRDDVTSAASATFDGLSRFTMIAAASSGCLLLAVLNAAAVGCYLYRRRRRARFVENDGTASTRSCSGPEESGTIEGKLCSMARFDQDARVPVNSSETNGSISARTSATYFRDDSQDSFQNIESSLKNVPSSQQMLRSLQLSPVPSFYPNHLRRSVRFSTENADTSTEGDVSVDRVANVLRRHSHDDLSDDRTQLVCSTTEPASSMADHYPASGSHLPQPPRPPRFRCLQHQQLILSPPDLLHPQCPRRTTMEKQLTRQSAGDVASTSLSLPRCAGRVKMMDKFATAVRRPPAAGVVSELGVCAKKSCDCSEVQMSVLN